MARAEEAVALLVLLDWGRRMRLCGFTVGGELFTFPERLSPLEVRDDMASRMIRDDVASLSAE